MVAKIFTDGASRGNPGLAGAGIVIQCDDGKVLTHKEFLGKKTNNEAEYLALILALKKAREAKIERVEVFVDSQLLERQIKGIYKVKAKNIFPLISKLREEKSFFKEFFISHVPREKNKKADALANEAIDERFS